MYYNPISDILTKTQFERILNKKGFPENETRCNQRAMRRIGTTSGYGTWLRKKYPDEFNMMWQEECLKFDNGKSIEYFNNQHRLAR
jgi:hypothetical protein